MRIFALALAAFVLATPAGAVDYPEATWEFHKAQSALDEGDFDKAVPILRKFAEEGNASAQWLLGGLYMNGDGVLKDLEMTAMWYRKALAEVPADIPDDPPEPSSGLHNEWNYLVLHLRRLRIMCADITAALGAMSFRGQGLPQDIVESYKWFELATHYEHPQAAIVRDRVVEELSADEIAEAEARTETWLAEHARFNDDVLKAYSGN